MMRRGRPAVARSIHAIPHLVIAAGGALDGIGPQDQRPSMVNTV